MSLFLLGTLGTSAEFITSARADESLFLLGTLGTEFATGQHVHLDEVSIPLRYIRHDADEKKKALQCKSVSIPLRYIRHNSSLF